MLSQLNHWIFFAGTAVDAALLLRVLHLRLQRTYTFITLVSLLTTFFDVIALWLGPDSRANTQVFLYSRFLYAFVLPAAAYDVWEEIRPQIEKIRRFAALRLAASLIMASIFGIVIATLGNAETTSGDDIVLNTFAMIIWAASSTASFAFLWSTRRLARAQKIALCSNTAVWLLYFQFSLAAEAIACFVLIASSGIKPVILNSFDVVLNLYEISITVWCVWRLRSITSGVPSAPEKAGL